MTLRSGMRRGKVRTRKEDEPDDGSARRTTAEEEPVRELSAAGSGETARNSRDAEVAIGENRRAILPTRSNFADRRGANDT